MALLLAPLQRKPGSRPCWLLSKTVAPLHPSDWTGEDWILPSLLHQPQPVIAFRHVPSRIFKTENFSQCWNFNLS
jgi:hypothetical protein